MGERFEDFLNSAPLKTPIESLFGLNHKLQFSLNCFILGKGQLATTTSRQSWMVIYAHDYNQSHHSSENSD